MGGKRKERTMLEKLKKENQAKMTQAIADLKKAFASIRTGRASLSLVDHLQVEAYGAQMSLIQMASLSTPDARTIVIQPFDQGQVRAIEKAIMASDVGITPNNDGRVIRLTIPQPTEERRKDLVKLARKYAEEHRVAVRQVRHVFIDHIKKLEKDKEISEDDRHRYQDDAQKITDEFIVRIDAEVKKKEEEIMEV
jgi:ribosome recycling factor